MINSVIRTKFLLITILLIGQVECKPLGTPNNNLVKADDDWIPEVIIAKQWAMNPYYRSKPVGYFWVPQPELEPKHDYEEADDLIADDLIAEGNEEIAAINKLKTTPSSVATSSMTEFTTENMANDNSQTTTSINDVTLMKTSSMTIESIAKIVAAIVLIILLLGFLYYFNFYI